MEAASYRQVNGQKPHDGADGSKFNAKSGASNPCALASSAACFFATAL